MEYVAALKERGVKKGKVAVYPMKSYRASASLALQGINNVHSIDSLSLVMLSVGNTITDHFHGLILQEQNGQSSLMDSVPVSSC